MAEFLVKPFLIGEDNPMATQVHICENSPQKTCCICGAALPTLPDEMFRDLRDYCSDRCREQGYRQRHKQRRFRALAATRTLDTVTPVAARLIRL